MNTVWIPHIPRTAGTSRRRMLEHNVHYNEYVTLEDRQPAPVKGIVIGHLSYCANPAWTKILFWRHPRERILSSYYYTLRNYPNTSIDEWVDFQGAMKEGYLPFTLTEHYILANQKYYNCAYIPNSFEHVLHITELDKFRRIMQGLGYNCKMPVHENGTWWEDQDIPRKCDKWIERETEYLRSVGARI